MVPVRNGRLLGLLALLVALVLAVAACGGGEEEAAPPPAEPAPAEPAEPAPPPPAEPPAFTPEAKAGIPGALLPEELALWQYDFETGKYEVVEGDASQPYVPNVRKAQKEYTIAFAEGWAAIPFSAEINKGVYRIAEEIGVKVIYCDNEFKADKAVTCAEQLASQKPDFAIESNWQAGAAAAVMKIWDDARIPVVNIDVVHPNGIFFGADNYTSGAIGGKAAGEYAKEKWNCEDVWIFMGENPGEGEAADLRLVGFADGVQEVCGALSPDHIQREITDAGTTDQAITKTTDWLTAHPDATHILATSIDDARATGIGKALVQSGREGGAVGPGCDSIGIEVLKLGPVEDTGYLGCVAFYPEKYPDYVMSVALDVLEGKAVPQEVHIEHTFLDPETIGTVYP